MEYNTFTIETDAKYSSRTLNRTFLITFSVLSLLACLGFLITWQTFVFFEALVLICGVYSYFLANRKGHSWRLEFKNDELTITNLKTGETFCVWDIPASDFVIKQKEKEKELDCCSLSIKNTVFYFGRLNNCSELRKYIKENYKQ